MLPGVPEAIRDTMGTQLVESNLIRGKRVTLRPFEAGFAEEELQRMYRWSRDESVLRWIGGSEILLSFEDFKNALRRELRRRDRHSRYFALLVDSGDFIGRLGYYNIDRRHREAELGIAIGEEEYWDRGYGTDAVQTLLAYIFENTTLERVYLNTYAENVRAQRSFEKCGFRKIGQQRRFSLERGTDDQVQMEIWRDDWSLRNGRSGR